MTRNTPTQTFFGCIEIGRGAPWADLVLTDLDGTVTEATFAHTDRADDGRFYDWAWQDTRLDLILPPRLLPWSMRHRRTRLLGRTIDGRYVGPFTVEPKIDVGSRVHFTDIADMEHDGTVRHIHVGAPNPYLVRPDHPHVFQWEKWCTVDQLTIL